MTVTPATDRPQRQPVLLFVFGMGRSGSSALTRVLSLCGGALSNALVGATEHNPLGHWEPQRALEINDAFLAKHGATWFDPTLRLQDELSVDTGLRSAYLEQISEFLRALPPAPLQLVKEPRITALSTFWFEAATRLGYSIRIVIPVRHPREVVASLAARDGATPELASALWLKYNLLAERHSREFPRVLVEYPSLLRDWRGEIARISSTLTIDLSARDEAAIDTFVRPDLRHERDPGQPTEVFGPPWLSRVYTALSAAARGEPLDTSLMDEILDAYRTCERAFRIALGDFTTRSGSAGKPGSTRNPNITQLIRAVAGQESQLLRVCLNSPWYLERNPDVAAAAIDPFGHWLAYGVNEGRLPCEDPLSLLQSLMQERTSRPALPVDVTRVTAGSRTIRL